MILRDYQTKTIEQIYSWWDKHEGNPCIVLPTGAGKSVIIAAFCQRALRDFPDTRILMCTHQKELIEQDYEKVKMLAEKIDTGIYSAGIGLKDLKHKLTFGSIQSIYKKCSEVGKVDLIIIDEAHLINHEKTGMYRTFIDGLKEINPHLKCIGLTATPYRLKHGLITDGQALFNGPLIEPVTILELQELGFLCKLTSKATSVHFDTHGVKITAGDYNQKELLAAVDIPGKNEAVVEEVIRRGSDRKAWLFFCSGISHAEHIRDLLLERGVTAECVTGKTPKLERERILQGFKAGKIRALTNANVLTTGFDHPGIDLICMMRPTLSPGLYVQMAGRGLRTCEGKKDCLVLDFADNVMTHGPITAVTPPKRGVRRTGIAPSKVCPNCGEIIPLNAKVCPVCFYEFPKKKEDEKRYKLSQLDINGDGTRHYAMNCKKWTWSVQLSKAGNRMLVARYYAETYNERPLSEFFPIWHDNEYVRGKALNRLNEIAKNAGVPEWGSVITAGDLCKKLTFQGKPPSTIFYHNENKYKKIDKTEWERI